MSSTGDRQGGHRGQTDIREQFIFVTVFLSLVQELIIGPVQINSIPVSLVPV